MHCRARQDIVRGLAGRVCVAAGWLLLCELYLCLGRWSPPRVLHCTDHPIPRVAQPQEVEAGAEVRKNSLRPPFPSLLSDYSTIVLLSRSYLLLSLFFFSRKLACFFYYFSPSSFYLFLLVNILPLKKYIYKTKCLLATVLICRR